MTSKQQGGKLKKLLITIHSLESGGAQKSLISFFKCLDKENKLKNYQIDLIVGEMDGVLRNEIPSGINIIQNNDIFWLSSSFKEKRLFKYFSLRGFLAKLHFQLLKRFFYKNKNQNSYFWKVWKKYIPENKIKYDIAIAYMDGWCSHYIIDKVKAEKKILWVHNEYEKLNYDEKFDYFYYKTCDKIITISQRCVDNFIKFFPEFKDKVFVLENISLKEEIERLASENKNIEFSDYKDRKKLLSIGRLCKQKGFDIAIEVAKILKEKNINYIWLILGKGEDYDKLQKKIQEYKLQKNFILLGERKNPYPYIKNCDIFLQTSRFEGKSIVLDEAKILNKPIIATNYETIEDSIKHNETGIIVELNPNKIAQEVINLLTDDDKIKRIEQNLQKKYNGNENELGKYLKIMFEEYK